MYVFIACISNPIAQVCIRLIPYKSKCKETWNYTRCGHLTLFLECPLSVCIERQNKVSPRSIPMHMGLQTHPIGVAMGYCMYNTAEVAMGYSMYNQLCHISSTSMALTFISHIIHGRTCYEHVMG